MTLTPLEQIARRLQRAGLDAEADALRAIIALYDAVDLSDVIALLGVIEEEPNPARRVARADDVQAAFARAVAPLQSPPPVVRELLTASLQAGSSAAVDMLSLQAAATAAAPLPDLLTAFKLRPGPEIEFAQHTASRLVRYWGSEQDELAKRVEKTVVEALERGQGRQQITAQLREELGFSKSRASLIARNELGNAASYGMQQTQTQAGVTEYEWFTANDDRVRGRPGGKYPKSSPSHWARRGKRFSWDAPPEGGHPGQAVQCRCTALAVLPDNWRDLVTGRATEPATRPADGAQGE